MSRVCDLWFVRYDLVHEVMSRSKWAIYLILCWFRVWYIIDVVFCKLHIPCIKSVIRRYNRVNFRVTVNLGQSSCYYDLRSYLYLQFDLPRSKGICFDAS